MRTHITGIFLFFSFYFVHNKNLLSLLIFGSFYLDEILFHFHFTSFISQAMTSIGNAKVSVMLLLCRKLHSDDAKNTERFCSISIFGVFFFLDRRNKWNTFFPCFLCTCTNTTWFHIKTQWQRSRKKNQSIRFCECTTHTQCVSCFITKEKWNVTHFHPTF